MPHERGWFYGLLQLFRLDRRPLGFGFDDGDVVDAAKAAALEDILRLAKDRRDRYRIFHDMDSGLVQSILDAYAEETTQPDYDKRRRVWIESNATHMVAAGEDALHNVCMEDRATPIVRRMAKMGDAYQRLVYATGKGVLGWAVAKPEEMGRVEDQYGRLVGFQQQGRRFRGSRERDTSWPWDYIHFRLLGKDEDDLYGTSILEAMYRPWRQLVLSEDAMLMYRLRRAPDRNLVFVDIGSQEEHEAAASLSAWRKRFKKEEFIDPASPEYQKRYNPLTPLEDIFVPVRDGTNSRVEKLSGAGNVGDVYDVDHFRRMFFGAAKAPAGYFGFEVDVNAKATLAQQDVRWARTLKRLQQALLYGTRQLLDIHFTLLGRDSQGKESQPARFDFTKAGQEYVVQMAPIAYLDEFERLELVDLRYKIVQAVSSVAGALQIDARVWAAYVLLHYAKLPQDMVLKLIQKTPDQVAPPTVPTPGLDALPTQQRDQVADLGGKQAEGFTILSEAEIRACAEAVHRSPALRRSISIWAEYGRDDLSEWHRQIDHSVLPPRVGGKPYVPSVYGTHDEPAKTLAEDLAVEKAEALVG